MSGRLKIKKRKGSQNYTTIIAIVIILIIAAGAYYFTRTPSSPPDETDDGENGSETPSIPDFEIELTSEEGETYTISSEDYKEMPKVEMDGGYKTSAGSIRGPHKYTGIPLSEVLDVSGGISNETSIRITASDGYAMVFTWEELNGDFLTFDPATGDEVEAQEELIPVLAYMEDDKPLSEGDGPFRLVILGEEGLITEGHFWIKQVTNVEVIPAIREYTLSLSGAINETMDRPTFESGTKCPDTTPDHQGVYVDSDDRVWTGIPLWLLVGRIDDNVTHTANAYNRALADQGAYRVQIIAGDGYTVELNSSIVKLNENILLANEMDGSALPEPYWPLRLVGDDLTQKEMIRNVVEVKLVFGEVNETETQTEVDLPEFELTLKGYLTEVMNKDTWLTATTCEDMDHIYSWTDKEGDEWTGIPVWLLVGRVDDDNTHGPEAFDRDLAQSGYQVSFVASDGYHKELDSKLISENNQILVAYLANGEPLPEDNSPLRVVGEGLKSSEMVSKLVQIEIIFPQ
jgi:DMSO/TMAO reductase YedYZ molybdopterin-dependent catalytic subunit